MTPEEKAKKAAAAMWGEDQASQWLGMELVHVAEGAATLSLVVQAHHCNGHGNCHGGVTFALADSAFAFACNSRNERSVAQHNLINYIAPARVGDMLKAVAQEVSLQGRSGIYDVQIFNQHDQLIATFRGMSRKVQGQLFEE